MMFYDFSNSPQIDTVFYKEDLTLTELLDQENILQELKSQNKKLIDFLVRPEVLLELVTLVTTEPKEDLPEQERYRHPHIACELLTTGIPTLNERLIEDEALLSKLYSFLEVEPPLNPLLASFFSRTMGELVIKRSEQADSNGSPSSPNPKPKPEDLRNIIQRQKKNWFSYQFTCLKVLEFLKSKESCIPLILRHLGTSAIMDLVLNFVTKVEGTEMKTNFLSWMASQRLIERLIELLEPSVSSNLHCNAALLLCDIISKSRESQRLSNSSNNKPDADPILEILESTETMQKLLNVILGEEKSESSIVGGITVILTLLEPEKCGGMEHRDSGASGGDSPDSNTSSVVLSTLDAILPHLSDLHNLLLNPPLKSAVKMTCGTVDPPLGNTRLHVTKLLATLISKHNPQIDAKLDELGTFQVLLDLFFRYTWNNFLHTLVEKCLALAINIDSWPSDQSVENSLLVNIFVKCRLLQRILDAWADNEAEQSKPGGCRRGYMGHIIRIAEAIEIKVTENSSLDQLLKQQVPEEEMAAWKTFISGPIANIIKTHSICLGGKHPVNSSSDDGREFRDVNFPQDAVLQQVYTEYNMQQVATQFIETFGFHESEFNETDDNLHPSVDRLANLSFNLSDDDEMEKQAEMFKQVCDQKLQPLEADDNDEEEVWIDHTVSSSLFNFKIWNGGEEAANYNSSDDEERPGPEGREEAHMDVDAIDPWLSGSTSGPVAESPANPWATDGSQLGGTSTPEDGWADFEANFGAATISTSFENSGSEGVVLATSVETIAAVTSLDNSSSEILEDTSVESRTEPTGAPTEPEPPRVPSEAEPIGPPTDPELLPKQDDNANPSSSPDNLAAGEASQQQLLENFRFLATQGLITEASSSSDSGDSKEPQLERMPLSSEIKPDEGSARTEQQNERVSTQPIVSAETMPNVPKVQPSEDKDQSEPETTEVVKTSSAFPLTDPV